jgi:hypothetical protein
MPRFGKQDMEFLKKQGLLTALFKCVTTISAFLSSFPGQRTHISASCLPLEERETA